MTEVQRALRNFFALLLIMALALSWLMRSEMPDWIGAFFYPSWFLIMFVAIPIVLGKLRSSSAPKDARRLPSLSLYFVAHLATSGLALALAQMLTPAYPAVIVFQVLFLSLSGLFWMAWLAPLLRRRSEPLAATALNLILTRIGPYFLSAVALVWLVIASPLTTIHSIRGLAMTGDGELVTVIHDWRGSIEDRGGRSPFGPAYHNLRLNYERGDSFVVSLLGKGPIDEERVFGRRVFLHSLMGGWRSYDLAKRRWEPIAAPPAESSTLDQNDYWLESTNDTGVRLTVDKVFPSTENCIVGVTNDRRSGLTSLYLVPKGKADPTLVETHVFPDRVRDSAGRRFELAVLDANGKLLTHLRTSVTAERYPRDPCAAVELEGLFTVAFSPDQTMISTRWGVMTIDGKTVRKFEPRLSFGPIWSPDGTRVGGRCPPPIKHLEWSHRADARCTAVDIFGPDKLRRPPER